MGPGGGNGTFEDGNSTTVKEGNTGRNVTDGEKVVNSKNSSKGEKSEFKSDKQAPDPQESKPFTERKLGEDKALSKTQ